MKVLFYTSLFQFQKGNGGKTIFLKTKDALERAGVQVDLFDQWRCDFSRYDLVHCFTMETTEMWDWVKAVNGRLAVSPISWFGPYATRRSRMIRWVKRKVRSKIKCPLHQWWEDYFRYPDMFFIQSHIQKEQMNLAFGVPRDRVLVIPHGVDERFGEAKPAAFRERFGIDDFILCVARFEPRKNQLSLIRALRGTELPLVFIGRADNERWDWYYDQCVREAGSSALFIRELDHDSELFRSAYAAARVLVLPSLLDFGPLVPLEAGLAGCNLALTRVGAIEEYFGEHAAYLDPFSESSIRAAVLDRYRHDARPNIALREHIRRKYLWDAIARQTIEGYEAILAEPRRR